MCEFPQISNDDTRRIITFTEPCNRIMNVEILLRKIPYCDFRRNDLTFEIAHCNDNLEWYIRGVYAAIASLP